MALQEMSFRDAMSRLEALYQSQGADGKVLMRVLPEGRQVSPPKQHHRGTEYRQDYAPPVPPVDPYHHHHHHHRQETEERQPSGDAYGHQHRTQASDASQVRRCSPRRSPGRRGSSPPNPNQWQLNYQVPKDAYGRYSPDRQRSPPKRPQAAGGSDSSQHAMEHRQPLTAAGYDPRGGQRSPHRSPGRRATSPQNPNQWRLNYQVPKDAYGRYSPDRDRGASPNRARSPASRRGQSPPSALSSQPTKTNKVPRYQYNPHDLTLSGPMSPPSPGAEPSTAPAGSEAPTAFATPSTHYTPPTLEDPRNRSILSPAVSLGARSARAHGNGPEVWAIQPKTTRYDAPPPPPVGPKPTEYADVSPSRGVSPNRRGSPVRRDSPQRSRVEVVSGPRGEASLVHSERPYSPERPAPPARQQPVAVPYDQRRDHVVSPPRPSQAPRSHSNTGGYGSRNVTPQRTGATPKRVNSSGVSGTTPRRGTGSTPKRNGGGGTTTPNRTTTPKRSNRYNHVQAKIQRIPQPAPDREHYEPRYHPVQYVEQSSTAHESRHSSPPRREKVGAPFFASSSQPHHQHANAAALSPPRSSQSRKGISWVVPS